MSKQWRLTLAATVACLLALALAQANSGLSPAGQPVGEEVSAPPAAAHNLEAVRVDTDATGRPVVRLEATGAVEYESFVLDGPDRLVLDLPGVVSRLDDYRYPVSQGGVVQVRAGQHHLEPYPLTRVVFDLEGPLAYDIERNGASLVVAFGEGPTGVTRLTTAEPVIEPVVAEPVVVAQPAQLDRVVEEMTARLADPPQATIPQAQPVAEADWDAALEAAPQPPVETVSRSVEPAEIERLLGEPSLAAPVEPQAATYTAPETRTVIGEEVVYTGRRISLNLVDADIKQVFRLFHEISGLNFVLDPGVSGRVTVVLDQVPWDQALDLILKNNGLDKVVEQNVLRIASTQKLAQEAASRKALKEAEEMEIELTTLTRTLSYAKAKDVQDMLSGQQQGGGGGGRGRGLLSDRAMVIMDERTNTLIITDIPKNIAALDQLITTLDSETPQVMIEARIVETSRSYIRDLGVTWGFSALADASRGTATSLEFPHNVSARYGLNLPAGGASTLAFSFGNVIDSFTLDLALDALETEGEGRVLSAPRIATQNNEMAEIEQGLRFPIVNTTATEINVEFVSASLRLEVTPQITAEGTIVLDVIIENNSPDFVLKVGSEGIPSIKTQRAETKVLVNDGGTTVIGGIFTVNEGQSEIGVPWFRKIPIFGWLFRSQNITNENRELLIFITPKIVKLG